ADSEKADIIIMFGARDSNAHIEEGIRSIVALLDNNDTMAKLRTARSREEVVALL
ncbi:PTS sugar transporter subunit IIA, partial [Klebsiella pneumoniae]|nr:PTS sugar transporter subunit IIA [Klebsiella pneumoniae]